MRPLDPRLAPHLRPARIPLLGTVAASVVGGLLTVVQAFAIGTLIVELVDDPSGSAWHPAAVLLAVVVVLRAVVGLVVDLASARSASLVSSTLRRRLLARSTELEATELSRHRTGELSLLATRGMAAVEPYFTRYLPTIAVAAVLPLATVAAMVWLDWLSGLIVLLTLPLVPIFAILIGMSTRDRADKQWRLLAALSGHFLDVVRGLPTLVAHRRASAQAASIRKITDKYRLATVDTLKLAFASSGVLEVIATLSVALVAVSVGLRLAAGSLDFQTALIVLLLAPEAYWPLRRVGAEYHSAAEGTAAFEAAHAFLTPEEGSKSGHATVAASRPGAGPLEVYGLTVGYGDRPVLQDLSVTFANPGMTAIVGPSGCGKSTLLAALTGEIAPAHGTIRVGDTDLAEVESDVWRRQFAWAPQRPWLTAGTIAQNLRIARPDASDSELWAALEKVSLGLVVTALPLALETPLGEDGAGLSAGQRARLALARVVLADRPYVFLDEPTAHLDEVTESVILDTLRWLSERSTVVVVAHRQAVVDAADDVLALEPIASPVASASSPQETPAVTLATQETSGLPPETETAEPWSSRFGQRTGIALGALSVASGVALTATAAWLITRASEHPPVLMLLVAIVAVRTFGLARPTFRYAERVVSHDAALRLLAERRAQVYDALVPLVPGRLGVRRGELLTSVVDDVDSLVDARLRVAQPLWTTGLVGAAATGFAWLLSPVAGAVIAVVVLVGVLACLVARAGAARAQADFVEHRALLSARVEELLHSARHLVLWQATDGALAAVDDEADLLTRANRRATASLGVARAMVVLASGLGVVAMAGLVPAGTTSAAMLALLVLLPLALGDALLPTADAGALSVQTRAAQARLQALTALDPAVTDPPDPETVGAAHPDLGLSDVTAGWGDSPAFASLSLELGPGQRIGVTGPSGSGKSTLAALMMRYLDPQSGSVDLAGHDLRRLKLDDVRRIVGLVDDDPYLFGSNLAENIRLARPEAGDADVEAALRAAHLGPWLDGLPDGLDTMIGEGHALVSGGERARIGIARALLADERILVLDEPTAHLDTATAEAVAAEILAPSTGSAAGQRSLVWITHGTVGLADLDRVIRLEATEVPLPDGVLSEAVSSPRQPA